MLINRYDGIDLPGDACHVLVLDGLLEALDGPERLEQARLTGSTNLLGRQVQRLEQGMGRATRSNEDHAVVLLLGARLAERLNAADARGFFSPATRAQLDLAAEIASEVDADSLQHARALAERAGEQIDYVQADVYSAPEVLGGRTFDLVYTGVGALCWLPDIRLWGRTVARFLRPGGRLFVRDAHPVLNSLVGLVVRDHHPDRDQQPWILALGAATPALELPYWEDEAGLTWSDEASYVGDAVVASPVSRQWNHALSEIVMAVLDAGLALELLAEHESVPWDALPGLMVENETGEYVLAERPRRLPGSFTLAARKS